MHEYNVTENIINIVEEEAKKQGVKKITSITLVIGELSSMVDECINMYFKALSKGKLCENAQLRFIRKDAFLECKICENAFKKNNDFICPKCGGMGKFTDAGREFYIESMEVE